jgi:hypothetical protein
MAKTITIKHNGMTYTLEFTRNSIELMEKQGFLLKELEAKPMSNLPRLFAGAFIAHHSKVNADVIDKIYLKCKDKQGLLKGLLSMYNETMNVLMDDPEGDDEGNAEWTANW